jgi:hypothetical protein
MYYMSPILYTLLHPPPDEVLHCGLRAEPADQDHVPVRPPVLSPVASTLVLLHCFPDQRETGHGQVQQGLGLLLDSRLMK